MNTTRDIVQQTLAALDLEQVDSDRFLADPGPGRGRLFGGLVAAQSVVAAGRTIAAERQLNSLHAYFLRPGTSGIPIQFEIRRLRDGGSFSTRHVTARQDRDVILEATTSFARDEQGLDHQTVEMPPSPDPATLPDREAERTRQYQQRGVEMPGYDSAVEVRLCDPSVVVPGKAREPRQENWLRTKSALGDDQLVQRAMLVYASDRTLLATARMPYGLGRHRLMSVSLDHALWIHRDVEMSEWHLCQCHSPVAAAGRSILLGHVYRGDGVCVATVAQEGLVRERRSP